MRQLGFDADKRLAVPSAKGDPHEAIDRLAPWETFRADIKAVVLTPGEMKKSSVGRNRDVSDAGFAGALQSCGRAAGVSLKYRRYTKVAIEERRQLWVLIRQS
jgi:hypothetical protein